MPIAIAILVLLLAQLPATFSQLEPTPSPLDKLLALENSISVAWRNNDRPTFESGINTALLSEIPKALVTVASSVTDALASKRPGKLMQVLTPVFTILSVVADILGLTLFADNDEFADLYAYLQDQFIKVNSLIEANFHAIKDLEKIVLCGQVSSEVRSRQTLVSAFFTRYKEMLQRAKTDRGQAMAIFDSELPQYQSSKVLLELRQMLTDKSLYAQLLTYCARGDLIEYINMMVELHHTFKQAIILDEAAKIRHFNLRKEVLDSDRDFWRNQMTIVVNLMVEIGTELVTKSWYDFYREDVDRSLSSTASMSSSDAVGSLSSALVAKYFYVRTAVIAVPFDSQSITITDAFGSAMQIVSADSFVCYRSHRASGETVIVFCRNVLVYPNEQKDLDSAYATYSRGVLSLSLVDAMRNDRWDKIGSVMNTFQVSFFAVKVVVYLNSGQVSTAQSSSASDLVFFQSEGAAFQALVIAKLVRGSPSAVYKVVPPTKIKSAGFAITAQWQVVAALVMSHTLRPCRP